MPIEIGVDTGGTHTDLVLFDRKVGLFETLKVPTTPDDLSEGILAGIGMICDVAHLSKAEATRFVYGTTLVTNLIVEQKAGAVGLITTEGFRDIVEIGRAVRKPNVYDINWRPKPPIVTRKNRIGIRERINASGTIIEALDEASVAEALDKLVANGVTSVAVCLLHAYANPVHEIAVREVAAKRHPKLSIDLSSEIVPQFREYERSSTISINAYVSAPLRKHLDRLSDVLLAEGVPASPYIMGGNGGVVSFSRAKSIPVSITHSGPVGGILGGAAIARAAGFADIITFDMGGTSSDVSLVINSEPSLTSRGTLAGYPVQLPTIDLVTIGAGGGSKASVDSGGALHVGPESAGSVPGPMCYGQDGRDPTITDANLFTGRLNEKYFLDGRRPLFPQLAANGIRDRIAKPLGLDPHEAALGILDIAEANMVNAIKLVSVQRGLDPRDFTLVGFGGAGPLHVVGLAEELGMRSVLVPPAPGNVSAVGMLCAEWRQDSVQTFIRDLEDVSLGELEEIFSRMRGAATKVIESEGGVGSEHMFALSLDLQFAGQGFELGIPIYGNEFGNADKSALVRRFADLHRERYGYVLDDRPVQIVNLRLTALGTRPDLPWPRRPGRPSGTTLAAADSRIIRHRKTPGETEWPVYRFSETAVDDVIPGPAIIEYPGSTLVLPPNWTLRYDQWGNGIAERD
jgi:N-methylhydantoinase A